MRFQKEKKKIKDSAQADYLDFIQTPPGPPPPERLTKIILTRVNHMLYPRLSHVIFKILPIYLLIGFLVLAICPQLGFKMYGENFGIARYFMVFGHEVCTALCGAFFLGIILLTSSLVLTREEIQKFNEYKSIITLLLCFVFLVIFLTFKSPTTQEILNWLLGAFSGGLLFFEIGSKIKINISRHTWF